MVLELISDPDVGPYMISPLEVFVYLTPQSRET